MNNTRHLAMLAIGLVFGGLIGFTTALMTGASTAPHGHDHGAHGNEAAEAVVTLDPAKWKTSVDLEVIPDAMGAGWNVHILTQDFTFAPQNASRSNKEGEGHAHIYADGHKLARVYGNWFHISDLDPGDVEIKVALYANDHSVLTLGDTPLEAKMTLHVEE
jgi:hypothetical protein